MLLVLCIPSAIYSPLPHTQPRAYKRTPIASAQFLLFSLSLSAVLSVDFCWCIMRVYLCVFVCGGCVLVVCCCVLCALCGALLCGCFLIYRSLSTSTRLHIYLRVSTRLRYMRLQVSQLRIVHRVVEQESKGLKIQLKPKKISPEGKVDGSHSKHHR